MKNKIIYLSLFVILSMSNTRCCKFKDLIDLLLEDVFSTSHQANANNEVTIYLGETVRFISNVLNDECEDSGESYLGVDVKKYDSNNNLVGRKDTNYLTPSLGESQSAGVSSNLTFNQQGEYEIGNNVDSTKLVDETNEGNNLVVNIIQTFLKWIINLISKTENTAPLYRIKVIENPAGTHKALPSNVDFVTFS